jgi:hypothetical protein
MIDSEMDDSIADWVVPLSLPTGIYHLKSKHSFGSMNSGGHVCHSEAPSGPARRQPENIDEVRK